MLNNTLFYFLQTKVILIEHLLSIFQIEIVLRVLAPRQVEYGFYICILSRVVGRLRMQAFELCYFFFENSGYIFTPLLLCCSLFKLFEVGLLWASAQFVLNCFYLLLKEVFFLLLVELFTRFHLDVELHLHHLSFTIEDNQQAVSTFFFVVYFQESLLLRSRNRQICTTVIYQYRRYSIRLYSLYEFLWWFAIHTQHEYHLVANRI